MRLRFMLLGCVLLFAVLVAGCGKGKTLKTSGRVTLDGQPVEGALVRFVPVDPAKGSLASGVTGSDGRFRLTTHNPNDGALPGDYIVLITYEESQAAPTGGTTEVGGYRPGQIDKMFQNQMGDMKKSGGTATQPDKKASKIPAVYGDPKAPSALKAKIPADGEIDLALRSQGG
jgi:hypothetical protein